MTTSQAFDSGARRYDLSVSSSPGYHAHLRRAATTLAECLAGRTRPWRLGDLDALARLAAAGFTDVATRTVPGWQRGILHTFVAHKPEEAP